MTVYRRGLEGTVIQHNILTQTGRPTCLSSEHDEGLGRCSKNYDRGTPLDPSTPNLYLLRIAGTGVLLTLSSPGSE